jgi:hypothetical protein
MVSISLAGVVETQSPLQGVLGIFEKNIHT